MSETKPTYIYICDVCQEKYKAELFGGEHYSKVRLDCEKCSTYTLHTLHDLSGKIVRRGKIINLDTTTENSVGKIASTDMRIILEPGLSDEEVVKQYKKRCLEDLNAEDNVSTVSECDRCIKHNDLWFETELNMLRKLTRNDLQETRVGKEYIKLMEAHNKEIEKIIKTYPAISEQLKERYALKFKAKSDMVPDLSKPAYS